MMTRIQRGVARTLLPLAAVALMSACAGSGTSATPARVETVPPQPRAALQPIALGSTITVLGVHPDYAAPGEESGSEPAEGASVGRATAAGAGAGALYGAAGGAAAGLACGPFFLICSPVMAVAGLAGGAIGGAIVGGTVASLEDPDPSVSVEQAEEFQAITSGMTEDLGVSQPLVDAFNAQAEDRWAITNSGQLPSVLLQIEQLSFDRGMEGRRVVTVVSSMTVSYGPAAEETTRRMLFPYTSPQHEVDYWLADEGAAIHAEIERAVARQSTDMIALLEGGMSNLGSVIRPVTVP